jgi:hypothetical protein
VTWDHVIGSVPVGARALQIVSIYMYILRASTFLIVITCGSFFLLRCGRRLPGAAAQIASHLTSSSAPMPLPRYRKGIPSTSTPSGGGILQKIRKGRRLPPPRGAPPFHPPLAGRTLNGSPLRMRTILPSAHPFWKDSSSAKKSYSQFVCILNVIMNKLVVYFII